MTLAASETVLLFYGTVECSEKIHMHLLQYRGKSMLYAGHRADQLQVRLAGCLVRAPRKIAFLENITGPSHRSRELLLDFIQPQPPPFVSALLYHIQAYPPDIVYSDLVEGPLDE